MRINYEAAATILATDNDDDFEELLVEAAQAKEEEGEAAQYDPSVLLVELYLATAIEVIAAALHDTKLFMQNGYVQSDQFTNSQRSYKQVWPLEGTDNE